MFYQVLPILLFRTNNNKFGQYWFHCNQYDFFSNMKWQINISNQVCDNNFVDNNFKSISVLSILKSELLSEYNYFLIFVWSNTHQSLPRYELLKKERKENLTIDSLWVFVGAARGQRGQRGCSCWWRATDTQRPPPFAADAALWTATTTHTTAPPRTAPFCHLSLVNGRWKAANVKISCSCCQRVLLAAAAESDSDSLSLIPPGQTDVPYHLYTPFRVGLGI